MFRFILLQCSATCGEGVRSRKQVCMRIYPRSPNDKQGKRKNLIVDNNLCAHMKAPPFIPKSKVCNRQCAQARWDVTAWSRVNNRPLILFHLS